MPAHLNTAHSEPQTANNPSEALDVQQAMLHPSRPEAEKQYDDHFYAPEVLDFAGVKPGVRMAIIGSAGVYYTSIASLVAGTEGRVYVHNASWSVSKFPVVLTKWHARITDSPMNNITPIITAMSDVDFPEALDLIFIDRFYHDVILHNPEDIDPMNRAIYSSLKPGGSYVVMDHHARTGTGTSDIAELHRIERSTVIEQIEQAGFTLVDESQAVRNIEDPRTELARRDKMTNTDRFLLKFLRPAES